MLLTSEEKRIQGVFVKGISYFSNALTNYIEFKYRWRGARIQYLALPSNSLTALQGKGGKFLRFFVRSVLLRFFGVFFFQFLPATFVEHLLVQTKGYFQKQL